MKAAQITVPKCTCLLGLVVLPILVSCRFSQIDPSAPPQFTRVTNDPVVQFMKKSTGCAWGDYNADGWLDLFVASFSREGNDLYHNNGDGTFSKVQDSPLTRHTGLALPCIWADYNNDGHLDLFLGNLDGPNYLYQGDGAGGFVARKFPPADNPQADFRTASAAWADYNNDGRLDLFVANGALFATNEADSLYRQLPNGTFENSTKEAGLIQHFQSIASTWADIDNDLDLDLFVTHRNQPNHLYINNGDGTFLPITEGHVLNLSAPSAGAACGDYDNDGDFDLCLVTERKGSPGPPLLYRNLGNRKFEEVTTTAISQIRALSISCAWADYDNDGWLDLFVSNHGGTNSLFWNNRDGTFSKSGEPPGQDSGNSGTFAWADYNNDGFLDLFVSNGVHREHANFLYRNNGNENHWLKIRLQGTASNRSAIGAKLRLQAAINGRLITQTRQITAGQGWAGQSPFEQVFGLGDANIANKIIIQWPSGALTELEDVRCDQILEIKE